MLWTLLLYVTIPRDKWRVLIQLGGAIYTSCINVTQKGLEMLRITTYNDNNCNNEVKAILK